MKTQKTNKAKPRNRASKLVSVRVHPLARPREETPLQECERMKKLMQHYRKLSKPSRDFVVYLVLKYNAYQLTEAA